MTQSIVPPSATPFSAPALTAGGINGLGSLRFVGTTNGGAPTSGTYQTGDVVLDLNTLLLWICTSGGTPGTWTSLSYLRTDSGAPNPQTVANQVLFKGNIGIGGPTSSWYNLTLPNGGGINVDTADSVVIRATNSSTATDGAFYFQVQNGTNALTIGSGNIKQVFTSNNTLDDGSGNMTVAGNIAAANFAQVKVFTSSTTWTVPQGVYRIFVQCWGGGGGGGGGAAVMLDGGSYYAYASGGGGGGGGYASGWLSVSPGQNITVNVGAGGVGGAGNVKNTGENAQGSNGSSGGSSSVLSVVAYGGSGGGGGSIVINAGPTIYAYAGGGGSYGGFVALYGSNGTSGSSGGGYSSAGGINGGNGGQAFVGGQYTSSGGAGGGTGGNWNGNNGSGIGAGGGGGGAYATDGTDVAGNGGNGTNGQVIIWW